MGYESTRNALTEMFREIPNFFPTTIDFIPLIFMEALSTINYQHHLDNNHGTARAGNLEVGRHSLAKPNIVSMNLIWTNIAIGNPSVVIVPTTPFVFKSERTWKNFYGLFLFNQKRDGIFITYSSLRYNTGTPPISRNHWNRINPSINFFEYFFQLNARQLTIFRSLWQTFLVFFNSKSRQGFEYTYFLSDARWRFCLRDSWTFWIFQNNCITSWTS